MREVEQLFHKNEKPFNKYFENIFRYDFSLSVTFCAPYFQVGNSLNAYGHNAYRSKCLLSECL